MHQRVVGQSALAAGLLLAPQALGTTLGLLVVGKLTDRLGPRPIVLTGLAVAVAGTVAYTRLRPDSNETLLAVSLLIWGGRRRRRHGPRHGRPYHGLPAPAIPRATSAITTVQTVGASAGAALLVTLLQYEIARHAGAGSPPDPAVLAGAYATTFRWALAITALAFIPALLLPAAGTRTPDAARA